jgi:hypothetical protein
VSKHHFLLLAAITALGLALRIAAARGGLWLDEAWSAIYARDSVTPLGVFLNVNHDNSHHLNTLWLQLVGPGAPPLLQRALAIATGTAAIPVAALIGARRGAATALATALLFATAPLLVTYGAEARGYAPMVLALLVAILRVDRWLDSPDTPPPATALALAALFGMLSQLTFVFGLLALSGWVVLRLLGQMPAAHAIWRSLRAVGPALLVALAVFAAVLGAGHAQHGFQFGAYDPFSWRSFGDGLATVVGWSFGAASGPGWLLPALVAVTLPAALVLVPALRPRGPFYVLAILAYPLAVASLQLGNSGFPRYYLLCAVALLLLAAEALGLLLARPGKRRWIAIGFLGLIALAGIARDLAIARSPRGDPGAALAEIARRAPNGADVAIGAPRSSAVLRAAAASAHYPLLLREGECPAARFAYLDRNASDLPPSPPTRCGAAYRPILAIRATGLSGVDWTLYERIR